MSSDDDVPCSSLAPSFCFDVNSLLPSAGGTGDDESGWIPAIPSEELQWSLSSFVGLGGLGIPLDRVSPNRDDILKQLTALLKRPTTLREGSRTAG